MSTFEDRDLDNVASSLPHTSLAGMGLDIVVADDNTNNRIYMKALLKGLGHRVRLAEDGEQAVAVVTQHVPDLVIMDMHMPVMDGFTAIQTLRGAGGAAAQVPILVLTADIRPELMYETHALGIQGYLFKPLEVVRLWPILEEIFPHGGRYAVAPQGGQQPITPPHPRASGSGTAAAAVPPVSAAPASPALQDHLNLRMVEDVVRIVRPNGYSEMLQEFSAPGVGNLAQLMARLSAGDTAALCGLAHATKGEAASLGLQRISQLAKKVEGFSADAAPSEAALVLAQLGEAWETSSLQLERLGFLVGSRTLPDGLPQFPA